MTQPIKPKSFERKATGLIREISPFRTLVFDLMFTSPAFMFLFSILGIGIFPGADMVVSTLVALLFGFVTAAMYAMLSIAYPRSGGDYIFVSRILTPSVGFTVNFVLTIVNISVIGVEAAWVSTMALGPMFSGLATLLHNPYFAGIAARFSQPEFIFIIGLISLLLLTASLFYGTKVAFTLKEILFSIALATTVIFIVVMATLPHSAIVRNFNMYSSTPYSQYSELTTSSGLPNGFRLTPTLYGAIYAVLALSGFTISSYVGGEVRSVKKSQFLGMFGAPTIYAVLMIGVLLIAYKAFGYTFLTGISYAALTGNKVYTLPDSEPWLYFIAAYATGNPYLLVAFTLGLLATLFAYMLTAVFASTRCLFAWTFDGIFPFKLASVSEKYHVPTYSLVAIVAVSALFIYLTVYTTFSAFFTYVVLASSASLVIVGLSALVFPFRRRETFNAAVNPVSAKLGGFPLISLVGILSIITSTFTGYVAMLPAFIGVFTPLYAYFIIILFVVGLIIYYISYTLRKRRGYPIDEMLKEIPPE